jgi:hypothetical protein
MNILTENGQYLAIGIWIVVILLFLMYGKSQDLLGGSKRKRY